MPSKFVLLGLRVVSVGCTCSAIRQMKPMLCFLILWSLYFLALPSLPSPYVLDLSTTPNMRVFHPSPNVSELNCHNKITKFHQAPLSSCCLTRDPAALPNFEELKLKASVRVCRPPKQLTRGKEQTVTVFIADAGGH